MAMMSLKGIRILTVAAAGFAFALTASAQSGTATSSTGSTTGTSSGPTQAPPGARRNNQQQRIAQGVGSGQLTAGETQHLENREAGISKETQNMRAEDDGHLTAADKAKLNQQYN